MATELFVKPDTKIMQCHFSGQTGAETAEVMRPLPIQADPLMETAIDRFDNLANTRQPAAPGTGPGPLTVTLGRTDHLRAIGMLPVLMPRRALQPFIGDIRPQGWCTDTGQAGVRLMPHGKKSLRQGLVLGTGRGIPKASDHPHGVDRQ